MGLVVNPVDSDLLELRWSTSPHGYAVRARRSGTTFLHRIIAERALGPCPDGTVVDHINGDRLDNRRQNLRYVDRAQHSANRSSVNSTGFRWVEATGATFRADVRWHGQRYRKAGFKTAAEAHAWATDTANQVQGGDAFHRVRGA